MGEGVEVEDIYNKYKVYEFVHWAPDNVIEELVNSLNRKLNEKNDDTIERIKVLDLGTSYGTISGKVAEKLATELSSKTIEWYVIEKDKESIDCFRKDYCDTKENLEGGLKKFKAKNKQNLYFLFQASNDHTIDVETEKFKNFINENKNQFHIVFAPWFFHHLVRWKRALALSYRALKSDGLLFLMWGGDAFKYYDGHVFSKGEDSPVFNFWSKVWREIIRKIELDWIKLVDINATDYTKLKDFLEEFESLWHKVEGKEIEFTLNDKNLYSAYESLLKIGVISPLKVIKYMIEKSLRNEVEIIKEKRNHKDNYENFIDKILKEIPEEVKENLKNEKRKWIWSIYRKKENGDEEEKADFFYYIDKEIRDSGLKKKVLKRHLLSCIEDFNMPFILPRAQRSKLILSLLITTKLLYPLWRENLLPKDIKIGFANIKLNGNFFIVRFAPFWEGEDTALFKAISFVLYWIFKSGKSFSRYMLEKCEEDMIILEFIRNHSEEKDNERDYSVYYEIKNASNIISNAELKDWKISYQFIKSLPRSEFILVPKLEENDFSPLEILNKIEGQNGILSEVNGDYKGCDRFKSLQEDFREPYIINWLALHSFNKQNLKAWSFAARIVTEYDVRREQFVELGTGTVILFTEDFIDKDLEEILKSALRIFYSKASIWKWREKTREETISANAQNNAIAIVARNFSHHFGSHIIEMLKRDIEGGGIDKPEKLIPVLDYIKERAELTADLSARVPFAWGKGNLGEILRTYFERGYSEKEMGYKKIWDKFKEMIVGKMKEIDKIKVIIKAKINGNGYQYSIEEDVKKEVQNKQDEERKPKTTGEIPDIEIALPFGEFIGRHLIYAILENEFRNIEKYRFLPPGEKTLKINFDIEDRETYYRINVSSNARIVEDDSKIDNKIKEIEKLMFKDTKKAAFVDEEGRPITEAWGFKEMRLCSGLLAGFKFEEIILNPKLWKFLPRFEKEKAEKEKVFSFSFYLRKYEPLFVVKDKSDLRSLESRYIEEVTQEEENIEVDEKEKDGIKIAPLTGFLVIHPSEEVLEEIVKNRIRYPLRIVLVENEKSGIVQLTEIYKEVYKSLLFSEDDKKLRKWIKSQYIFLKNIEGSDEKEKYVNLMREWNIKKLQGEGSVKVERITTNSIMLKYSTCTQHNCEEEWKHGPDYSTADTIVRRLPDFCEKDRWFLLKSKVLLIDDRLYNNLVDEHEHNFNALVKGMNMDYGTNHRLIILPEKGTKIVKQNDDIMVVFEHNGEEISHKLSDFTIASFHLGFLEELKKNSKAMELFDKGPENLDKFAKLMFIHTGRGKLSSEFENYFWFQKLFSYSDLEACTRSKRWLTVKLSLLHAFLWS